MLSTKYQHQLRDIVRQFLPATQYQLCIFGSALQEVHFQDVDLGIVEEVDHNTIEQLRTTLEESTYPYDVDIVTFATTSKNFRESVLHKQPKLWI